MININFKSDLIFNPKSQVPKPKLTKKNRTLIEIATYILIYREQ